MFEQFQIIGHRGFSAKYPENTLLSFNKAIEAGATMIELDCQLTKDNHVAIFHDEDANRLCGRFLSIRTTNRIDIEKLTVDKEPIPMFDDLLDALGDNINYYIELKMWPHASIDYKTKLVFYTINEIHKRNLQNKCLIASFNPLAVQLARRLGYNNVGYIYDKGKNTVFNAKVSCPKHSLIKKPIDKKITYAWTVNNRRRMKTLIEHNVNGIVTNHPDRLKEVYNEVRATNSL